ncbi:nucleic-acid-binding protein from mobile element jockey-like isoform x2 protein [Lasius niger]|uniref:Nucleic-acid-binding protein from mobile element jockey-like isoform x2 protein n=1 Tax=Lasius niger TaxID=67767 RepID=A0A0J7KM58_LASNI|nr:nucleic-acid-binding protein from mobile element jockey-like isoform x2 protein [Lasius niger]
MASGGEDSIQNLAQSDKISTMNANLHSDRNSMHVDVETASASEVLQSLLQETGIKRNHSFNKPVFVNKASLIKRPLVAKDAETEPLSGGKIRNSDESCNLFSHSSNTTESVIFISEEILKNRYSSHNQGPFDVHVQRISDPRAPLHPITVGRIIYGLNNEDILEIKKIGFSKVSIFLKTKETTNQLVSDQRLQKKDLIAFIPPSRTSRKGIIRNVPLYLTDQNILENIKRSGLHLDTVQLNTLQMDTKLCTRFN